MFRLASRLGKSFSLRAITDRLDSFEKEMIELKAFRQAVECTSPEVAESVKRFLKENQRSISTAKELDLPLTPEEFIDMTQYYALQQEEPIQISKFPQKIDLENLFKHSLYFREDMLVRIALLAKALTLAPLGLSQMPQVQRLIRYYQLSFHDLVSWPAPKTVADLHHYDKMSRAIFLRHFNVSRLLCDGLLSLGKREGWWKIDMALAERYPDLQEFFQNFFSLRVRMRLVCGNYVHFSSQVLKLPRTSYEEVDKAGLTELCTFGHEPSEFVGQVCKTTSLLTLVKFCLEDVKRLYADAVFDFQFHGDESIRSTRIPYILYDMVVALLCDAVEANIYNEKVNGKAPAPIEVKLVQTKNSENYTLRVSDTAGGMCLEDSRLALTCWSTFRNSEHKSPLKLSRDGISWIHSPIRLSYANSGASNFGGKVSVTSIEGYGTDRQLNILAQGVDNLVL